MGVHIGAVRHEHLGRLNDIRARHRHQRRLSLRIGGLDIGAGIQQRPQSLRVGALGRFRQRRGAVVVGHVDLGAGLEQPPEQRQVIMIGSPMQRRGAIVLMRIDIGVGLQQRERGGRIAGGGDIGERIGCTRRRRTAVECGHHRQRRE